MSTLLTYKVLKMTVQKQLELARQSSANMKTQLGELFRDRTVHSVFASHYRREIKNLVEQGKEKQTGAITKVLMEHEAKQREINSIMKKLAHQLIEHENMLDSLN